MLGYVEHPTHFLTGGSVQLLSTQRPCNQPFGQLGRWGDSMADVQGTHRHHSDPRYGFALWMLHWGLLKDGTTRICSVSGWAGRLPLPGSWRRVFEREMLVERVPLSCLDPGLFHPTLTTSLIYTVVNYLHHKGWLIPWAVYLLANCSGINQLAFQSSTDADKKQCNVKTNTKGKGAI